jgi:hypothetical protein
MSLIKAPSKAEVIDCNKLERSAGGSLASVTARSKADELMRDGALLHSQQLASSHQQYWPSMFSNHKLSLNRQHVEQDTAACNSFPTAIHTSRMLPQSPDEGKSCTTSSAVINKTWLMELAMREMRALGLHLQGRSQSCSATSATSGTSATSAADASHQSPISKADARTASLAFPELMQPCSRAPHSSIHTYSLPLEQLLKDLIAQQVSG